MVVQVKGAKLFIFWRLGFEPKVWSEAWTSYGTL